jgi:hypothetical protein
LFRSNKKRHFKNLYKLVILTTLNVALIKHELLSRLQVNLINFNNCWVRGYPSLSTGVSLGQMVPCIIYWSLIGSEGTLHYLLESHWVRGYPSLSTGVSLGQRVPFIIYWSLIGADGTLHYLLESHWSRWYPALPFWGLICLTCLAIVVMLYFKYKHFSGFLVFL